MRRGMAVVGLVLVSVFVPVGVQAGGGGPSAPCVNELSNEKTVTVDIDQSCYLPVVARIDPGDVVKWTNREGVPHTVSGIGQTWGEYRDMGRGDSVSYRFDDSGVYPYFCAYHLGMVGVVVVGDGAARGHTGSVVPMGEDQMPLTAPTSAPEARARSMWPVIALGGGAAVFALALVVIGRLSIARSRISGAA